MHALTAWRPFPSLRYARVRGVRECDCGAANSCRAVLADGSRYARFLASDHYNSAPIARYRDTIDQWCSTLPPSPYAQAQG